MTDLSNIPTDELLGTLEARQREGAAELVDLREQRDTLAKVIKDKAVEQDKLDRLIRSMTPTKRPRKLAVNPEPEQPAAPTLDGTGEPPPAFQPE